MKHSHLMSTLDFRVQKFATGNIALLSDGRGGPNALDFFADVGTASLGYNSQESRHVLHRMLDEHIPIHAPNLYGFDERDRAARRLCEKTGMDRVFFCSSGTEAVEAAIKLARLHCCQSATVDGVLDVEKGWRYKIASFKGGFHGRTYGGMAAGDGPPYHTFGFGPLLQGFEKFGQIEEISEDAAAVILAPVFGNNDVVVYPDGWLQELRAYCDEHGILLIFDEVQTGSGRCGINFTYGQRVGVRPDIITLAKGLGMGAPVGACLARGEVADTFTPGSHFSTFGGNPLSCAFINGMLDWATENAMEQVDQLGHYIRDALVKLDFAKNVRGIGMLNAFDIDIDTVEFAWACQEEGLLIGAFRSGPGAVKITPPLNITFDHALQGIAMMERAYDNCQS